MLKIKLQACKNCKRIENLEKFYNYEQRFEPGGNYNVIILPLTTRGNLLTGQGFRAL